MQKRIILVLLAEKQSLLTLVLKRFVHEDSILKLWEETLPQANTIYFNLLLQEHQSSESQIAKYDLAMAKESLLLP